MPAFSRIASQIWLLAVLAGCSGPLLKNTGVKNTGNLSPSRLNPLGNFERSIIFQPARYPAGDWQPEGLPFVDAYFPSADGVKLHGWFIEHENPRAVILVCHGNGGNITSCVDELRILHDRVHATVLAFDYRGYGRSEGQPGGPGIVADARAARAWLAQRAAVDESHIVLMGRSLGGGVAVELAAKDGARALVLQSTFTSLPDVAKSLMPAVPARVLMQTRFNSLAKIRRYHGPLLQSHGDADRLIPFALGQRLFDAANEPKQFVRIERGDHNDPQPDSYYDALIAFLDSTNHAPTD